MNTLYHWIRALLIACFVLGSANVPLPLSAPATVRGSTPLPALAAPVLAGAVQALPAATPEPPPADTLPGAVTGKRELVEQRTADSATFDMGDGKYALVQNTQPMHYQDSKGNWQRINPAFAPVPNGWANTTNALRTGVSARGGQANIAYGQAGVIWSPRSLQVVDANGQAAAWATALENAQAVTGTLSADGRTVTYPASWSDSTLQDRWASGYGQAEYSLRMAQRPAETRLFPKTGFLELGVTLRMFPGTRLQVNGQPVTAQNLPLESAGELTFVNEAGETLVLRAPQAFEEHNPTERIAGSYRLAAGQDAESIELAARIPAGWFASAGRQFPVVLDPMFQVKWPIQYLVARYNIKGNFQEWAPTDPMGVGQYGDDATRALVRFTLPTLPPEADITSAALWVLPRKGTINCAYNPERPDYCWGDSRPRDGLTADLELFELDVTSQWWTSPDPDQLLLGESLGVQPMSWSNADGSVSKSWEIPDGTVEAWKANANANGGLVLKLAHEYCFQDKEFNWGGGWGGSPDKETVRFFPDGCGWFDFDSPVTSAYETEATPAMMPAPNGGIWLVVEYTAHVLNVGEIVTLPDDYPIPSSFLPDNQSGDYFNAEHEYQLGALSSEWSVVAVRGLGSKEEPPEPHDPHDVVFTRTLQGRMLMELWDEDTLIPVTTYADKATFMAMDGPAHAGSAPQVLLQKSADDVQPAAYDIWSSPQKGSLELAAPGTQSIEYTFRSYRPAAIWNVQLPATGISRVDVTIVEDNVTDLETQLPDVADVYYKQYADQFHATLFKSGSGAAALSPKDGFPLNTRLGTFSEDTPLSMNYFPKPEAGDTYGLVVAYDGPQIQVNECIAWNCTTEFCDCDEYAPFELEFTVQVRVTNCPDGEFPLASGGCQTVRCPDSAVTGHYIEHGGLGLWSESGWDADGNSNAGNAVMIGPPDPTKPPTIFAAAATVRYYGTNTVSITGMPGETPAVALVNCGTDLADPNNPVRDESHWVVYTANISRSEIADEGNKVGLEAFNYTGAKSADLYNIWGGEEDTFGSGSQFYILPDVSGQSRAKASVPYEASMQGDDLSEAYPAPVEVKWWIDYHGWSSLASSVADDGVAYEPTLAGLILNVGDTFSMDIDSTSGGVPDFVAIRASDATVSQPGDLGGASKPVQALILLPRGQNVEGTDNCRSDKNCVDLRAPEDTPDSPQRTWQMPDIHTGGTAGMVMVSTPGKLQAWSVDHPAMANSPQAASQEFSFDTFGGSVKITQEKCGGDTAVMVVRGETQISLPMIGDDGASHDTMLAARFKLCNDPSLKLRQVEFEFRSPVGVPVGSTGLFVNGLKGSVEVNPGYTQIKFGMDFYYGDPSTLQGTGEVTIDTRGMFEFQGAGKILGMVDATGRLWVAWDPLDTGFEMGLRYELGDVALIKGDVRAHAWRGQGWQNKYTWLPNDPTEDHFAAQISASFTLYAGIIDLGILSIPPVELSRSIEIAFGQFCTNNSCSEYEWGIKAALEVCGYDVGVYYGFDEGVDVILGNDGHTLIDQFGGAAYAANSPLPLGEGVGVRVQTAPQAINGVVTMPLTITQNTEGFLVGLGWQAGFPTTQLYEPDGTPVISGTKYAISFSYTTHTDASVGKMYNRLVGVRLKQPGPAMAGIWKAVIGNVEDKNHFKFAFLANKGAPGTPADRGEFTAPASGLVNGTGGYTIKWPLKNDIPLHTTISLYYSRYYREGVQYIEDGASNVPIVLHHDYRLGQYTWTTLGLLAKCARSDDDRCYYQIRAVVDDGVNDFPAGAITDSGNYCQPCSQTPGERAFDPNRFPGTSTFSSAGLIYVTDSAPPATPTGLTLTGMDSAIMARWNRNTEQDLAYYLVEWAQGMYIGSPPTFQWTGEIRAERVAPTLTPTLRIGGLSNDLHPQASYGIKVSAVDINGNASPRTDFALRRPNTNTSAQIPTTPLTPTLSNPTSTGVRLQWSSDGEPDHYRLVYRQVMTFATVMQIDNIAATYHTIGDYSSGLYALTGLQTGATYEAWVTAANADGWHSAYSGPARFTVTDGVNNDGTGAPDDWEAAYGAYAMYNYDEDFDGLTNLGEYQAGTHPLRQDSDDDGYSDKEEVDAGTDPWSNTSYPAAYAQPRLALETHRVNLYAKQGVATLLTENVNFYNNGGGALDLTASDDAAWLSAYVETGVGGNYIRLFANFETLAPGTYDAIVSVNGASGVLIGGRQCIRVRLHLLPADTSAPLARIYLPTVMRDYPPEWTISAFDVSWDNGTHTSAVADQATNKLYVSYYDAVDGDLRMVNPAAGGAGNCGPGHAWQCQVVKSADNVGKYSSIDLWPGAIGLGWKVGIAYYNDTTDSLEYAEYTEGGSWAFTVVDSGEPTLSVRDGLYTSLKFAADGRPRIAYYASRPFGDDMLRFAEYVGGSSGTCSDTAWNCSTIESGEGVGRYASMDLDADGNPHVAYYDSGNSLLRYAHYVGSGGNCGPDSSWQCDTLETVVMPTEVDRFISLSADSGSTIKIAYNSMEGTIPVLKYAKSTAGECGPNNTWTCVKIAENAAGLSLAATSALTRIAYHDADDGRLMLARPALYGEKGSCGPVAGLLKTWRCMVVDDGARSGGIPNHVGHYPAIALDSNDRIDIAYYDFTLRDLTIALQWYQE